MVCFICLCVKCDCVVFMEFGLVIELDFQLIVKWYLFLFEWRGW